MLKKEVLKDFINNHHAFSGKHKEFLNNNLDKFSDFVEVRPEEIFDYCDLDIVALIKMKRANKDAEMLMLMTHTDITYFINRKFEQFCIAIAMGEI